MVTAESLSMAAGVLLSLGFSYIPGLHEWYMTLTATYRRLLMLGLLVVAAGASFGLACLGWVAALGSQLSCDQSGLLGLVRQTILAVIANQSVYAISPRSSGSSRAAGGAAG